MFGSLLGSLLTSLGFMLLLPYLGAQNVNDAVLIGFIAYALSAGTAAPDPLYQSEYLGSSIGHGKISGKSTTLLVINEAANAVLFPLNAVIVFMGPTFFSQFC